MPEDFCTHFAIATQLLFAVLLPQGVLSLKLLRVDIPPYILRGEGALLQCEYELEYDRLYSVTWYKDHEEFYRYVSTSTPKKHSYSVEGIIVDHHLSDNQKVILRNVSLKASGTYRCEVSGEAPLFTSVHGEGRMEVVALPKEGPLITGQEGIYEVGDDIILNCTSGKSFPAARLTWYINGIQVMADFKAVVEHHELMTSVIGLKSVVTPQHFLSGHMHIRCVATISTSTHYEHHDRASSLEDNREVFLLIKGDASRSRCSAVILLLLTSLATWLVT